MKQRILAMLLALALLAMAAPTALAADSNTGEVVGETVTYAAQQAALTFTDGAILETQAGNGYTIDGTTLTITAAGTYRIGGSCAEGAVVVAKGLDGVTLILDSLTLTSAVTAPIVVKKTSHVLLVLEGESTLTDNEDATTEATNEAFEGAAIKVKSGGTLTLCGDGALRAVGNAKNGIKGGAETGLTVDGGSITVTAANNGIAFDGSIRIRGGSFDITSGNDGIKAVPDADDTASAGTIEITGGAFTIHAQGDGIQADARLTITDGSFSIQTENGYQSATFDADTMSCKGLKASGTDDDTENADNTIEIRGGTFHLNTADDAVHSDAYCTITGGTFYIYTGDDGVHADTTLTLGTENGYERDPEIFVYASYEGLESGTVNAYSGKYWIVASDDGINAAGGSSGNGGDHFNPGRPGQPGRPGESSGDYSLNFYGGDYYVNCTGDGLDSNGALNLYGGTFTILSQATGGDNSPLDSDGTLLISGATVFAAGTNPMRETPSSASQKYYTSTTSRSAGTILNVSYGGSVVYSETLVRNINYLLYSSPAMTSTSCTVSTASAVTACKSNAWAHSWDDGVVETAATESASGVMKFTCTACGDVERKTIPQIVAPVQYVEASGGAAEDAGFSVSFRIDGGATVDVFYTQDYTAASESNVTSAVSRNGDSGRPDSSGSGQVNFRVNPAEGCTVTSVSVDGSYKNIKGPSDTGCENTYRITKVASALTVTIQISGAHAHTLRAVAAADATCEDNGTRAHYVCTGCGKYFWDEAATDEIADTSSVVIAALGHDYVTSVVAPTEEAGGYTLHTCARCGNSYRDNETAPLDCPSAAFADLDRSRWYHEGVDFVLKNGYMAGTDKGFQPDAALTREMLAQILYAKAGKPAVTITGRFPDEDTNRWYAAAIEWAAENGYIAGYGNGNFGVGDAVTREQIAVILYAYEGKPDVGETTLDSYPDAGQVSGWARTAMVWAVENGLITGNAKGELMPKDAATRATFAVIFYAYLEK